MPPIENVIVVPKLLSLFLLPLLKSFVPPLHALKEFLFLFAVTIAFSRQSVASYIKLPSDINL